MGEIELSVWWEDNFGMEYKRAPSKPEYRESGQKPCPQCGLPICKQGRS